MRKFIMLAATLVASFCLSVPTFAAAPSKVDINDFKINWADEFTGTELNLKNWTPQVGNGSAYGIWEWGNNEKEFYKSQNISVSNGSLRINAKYEANAGKADTTTYNFSSGRMTSAGLVEVGYGYVEARIKIPSAKGIWPAFWMLGTNGKVWPRCGEIDIMEAFNTRSDLQATVHFPDANGSDLYNYYKKNLDDKTQWHTYGCYRDGNVCAFYIDRERIGLIRTSNDSISAYSAAANWSWVNNVQGTRSVLNDKYYILLNVACGGNLAGGMPDSSLNAYMDVDYVRYYTEKPESEKTTQAPKKETTTAGIKKPGKASIKKAKNVKKKKIKLTLKKMSGVAGYKIRWCESKSFQGYEEKTVKKTSYTIKGLSKGKWYIKVRAYKMNGTGKLWGTWSKVKTVKVKK